MQLNLPFYLAADLASFLSNPYEPSISFASRGGRLYTAIWDTKWLNGVRADISTQLAHATLSKCSAALLADKIEQVMCATKLGEPENKPDPQSVDSLDGPMRRMDNNLRSVFG